MLISFDNTWWHHLADYILASWWVRCNFWVVAWCWFYMRSRMIAVYLYAWSVRWVVCSFLFGSYTSHCMNYLATYATCSSMSILLEGDFRHVSSSNPEMHQQSATDELPVAQPLDFLWGDTKETRCLESQFPDGVMPETRVVVGTKKGLVVGGLNTLYVFYPSKVEWCSQLTCILKTKEKYHAILCTSF